MDIDFDKVDLHCNMFKGNPFWTTMATCDRACCPMMARCNEYLNMHTVTRPGVSIHTHIKEIDAIEITQRSRGNIIVADRMARRRRQQRIGYLGKDPKKLTRSERKAAKRAAKAAKKEEAKATTTVVRPAYTPPPANVPLPKEDRPFHKPDRRGKEIGGRG